PNGATTYYSYDKGQAQRVDQIETVVSSTTVQKLTYNYYSGGYGTDLRRSVTDKDGNRTSYTYDALNELTLADQRDSGNNVLNKWFYNLSKYQYDGSTVTGGHGAAVRSWDRWTEGVRPILWNSIRT
ncbi:MAG: hypothetical protein HY680_05125, partial [Chloroflexi bacterium]|nr:hypothetical protein [Chloroflexota bacterium]